MIFAILLLMVGIALAVGDKSLASQIAQCAIGVLLALCVVQSCSSFILGAGAAGTASTLGDIFALTFLAVLAAAGGIAWRRRADRMRVREIWSRRNGSPRSRALPAAPPADPDGPLH